MKLLTKLGLVAFLASGMSFSAQAIEITPTSGTSVAPGATRWSGNQTSQSQINAAISGILGSSTELYKQNVGGAEEKALAGSYTTTFDSNDPEDALIKYVSGDIVGGTAFLLVKDGNHSPAWYLFNLTALGWNGIADIEVNNFWPAGGAISHVTLYGTRGSSVPDGGTTLALLGMAIGSLGLLRRKIS
ncbi:MAG: VPDSG-CTERM sorting domain-containing protein [Opitutaceae bacterium]|nr:VPDSG-CTERM sorting domain-containing protein [Verrucomicrobiales bacterium]